MAWSLSKLLHDLHQEIEQGLERARSYGHPVSKGDGSQEVWLELFAKYLPKRYEAVTGFVVDCEGKFSDQIDVIIFDRQYSPFILNNKGQYIVPAESVYGVFEAKQAIDASQVDYAHDKIKSVRQLRRTSLPIPHAGGVTPPKPPIHILGGILTFDSEWKPTFGEPINSALAKANNDERIDIGCVAAHGHFWLDRNTGAYEFKPEGKPATAFLFRLLSMLQESGTVSMIDIQSYARWLTN